VPGRTCLSRRAPLDVSDSAAPVQAPCCYTGHGVQSFFPVQQVLWAVSLIAQIVLLARLFQQRLIRRYPFFAIYLLVETILGLMAMQITVYSRAYAEAYRTYNLVIPIFRLGVAAELYERIFEHFPGVGRFRIGLATFLVLIGALFSVGIFRPDLAAQWVLPQTVVTVIRRFEGEILATVFLLTWIFFRYMLNIRQPFRNNVLNHWKIATVYFGVSGANALAILLVGRGPIVYPINSAMLAADIGCFIAWIRLMRRSGEQLPPFQRLSRSEIEAVERHSQDLLGTAMSLPRQVSGR
jgi:hypothetical protein